MNALIEQMGAQISVLNDEHYALTEKVNKWGINMHGETATDPADQPYVDSLTQRMREYIKIRDEELERIGILGVA